MCLAHCTALSPDDPATVTALACLGVERGMQPYLLLVLDPESVARVEFRNTAERFDARFQCVVSR